MSARVRFLYDPDLHRAANDRGENYWYAYVREVADQMGLTAEALAREDIRRGIPPDTRALILPDLPADYLGDSDRAALSEWVEGGGLLIGLATDGLDALFGIHELGRIDQPGDAWSYSATLRLVDEDLARPLYAPEILDAALLIVAPVRVVSDAGQSPSLRELARLISVDGEDLRAPAVTLRDVGAGKACYFAFDLCQTLWALHQGRPILDDRDGDGYLRMSDAVVIRPFRIDVPYADLLLLLLRNVLAEAGVSFIHPLPPTPEGEVPDALFFWGGDDEGAVDGSQVVASDWMREQGLPYHINIMPHADGSFGLTREEYARIKANAHETSLHFNYVDGHPHPYAFSEADVREQVDWYEAAFGETPVCSVLHWTLWHGWSEPAEWMAACGLQADNSRIHTSSPPLNPVNLLGYAFGAALPFRHWSDWRRENRRVDLISEAITAYECGYVAGKGSEFTQLHRAIRDAAHYQCTMDFFYHPVNIANRPECREAIVECLRYADELGLRIVHMGNDALNDWWRARSAARIDEQAGEVSVDCDWPGGCIVVRRSEAGVEALGGKWEYQVHRR